ncbi:fused DSP-PTPase phosphatase/NAD kinase-like protein [Paludisphaera borealis]|uniref:DSP-PTPase phosphatase fused to NAD+ Kinase domain-containing protein n=1 Tax=Paludisphaera borealis TaxID=1387353 RepID=A0A1U7CVS0_9BACT|nr:hypothetical protein [Paludisphaera borealis]APW63042.1 hypothetical protein BSF38_04600 [Paludisphaera borealis]
MFSLRWLRERGIIRARPSISRRQAVRAVVLSCMVVAALLQTGCRSSGVGLCSPCGFVGRTKTRIMETFRRGAPAAAGCCGSEIGSEVPMEYGAPIGVAPAVPLGAGTQVIQGGPVPSSDAPATDLRPLDDRPSAQPGPAPGRGSRSSTDSSVRKPPIGYDAQRPAGGLGRGDNLAHTLVSSPASTARSSQDAVRTSNKNAAIGDSDNVLDHLPPLDLPADVTGRGDSPPVAPAAVKPQAAASAPASAPAVSSANDHPGGRSAREAEAALAAAAPAAPAPDVATTSGDAIGIARFVAVDLKLAGGSGPSAVGLGWLVEKGYKTVLDLRDSSQTSPAFIGEAASRGLRYVAFPVKLDNLNREQLDRFSFELSLNDARPLYFFDDDGRRAGAMWYIRRILTDKVSPDIARREAEELGLNDAASWKLVQDAVDRQLAPRTSAPAAPAPAAPAAPATPPAAPAPAPKPATPPQAASPSAPPTPVADAMRKTESLVRASFAGDPDAWQPFAAMVLTGLTFPLAYFSRTVIPTMLAKTRASLPGPARRSKSLPPASGA